MDGSTLSACLATAQATAWHTVKEQKQQALSETSTKRMEDLQVLLRAGRQLAGCGKASGCLSAFHLITSRQIPHATRPPTTPTTTTPPLLCSKHLAACGVLRLCSWRKHGLCSVQPPSSTPMQQWRGSTWEESMRAW